MSCAVSTPKARYQRALLGGALAVVIAAGLEAAWVRAGNPALEAAQSFLFALGVLAPLGLVVGALVGAASLFLHPRAEPSPTGWWRAVDDNADDVRAKIAFQAPAFAAGLLVFLLVVASGARALLASSLSAAQSGALLASLALASGLVLWTSLSGLAELLSADRRGAKWAQKSAVLSMTGFGLVLVLLTVTGETSGAGGPLAMFGVLCREELDLRAPGLLAMIVLFAYLAPWLFRRVPSMLGPAAGALILVATFVSAVPSEGTPALALGVERGAPLARLVLPVLQALDDSDGDGQSAWFGGGDCDDTNPNVYSGAKDIPENGIDEDCSGADAKHIVLEAPAEPAPSKAPALPEDLSVVLLTVDTLRYDLGYAGNPRPVSPNLDRLAEKSVVFERSYALASYTAPSLAPMLIGKYGSETHRDGSHFARFSEKDTFLSERLQRAGVRTVSIQGHWYFFFKGYGFERGFDVLDSSAAPKVPQGEGDRSVTSDKISDAAIAELRKLEASKERFFLWLHYVDPHAEYVPHQAFDFGNKGRERYDGEVAFTDHHIGRVLDFLEKSPLAARTALVFTSDHGEAFGEHNIIRHGFELWEELIRVPMMIFMPGAKPHRVSERRSIIDVAPTILDLFGMLGETPTDELSGQSLLPDVSPGEHQPKPRIVFADMPQGPYNAERKAFIENDLKLVTSSGRVLGLFDLAADPGETRDLSRDAELKERVFQRFTAFSNQLDTVHVKPRR